MSDTETIIFLYRLKSGTGFMLSVNPLDSGPGGQLILATADTAELAQLWQLVFFPPTQACLLYNPFYNVYAAPSDMTQGAPIVLCSALDTTFSDTTTWQVQPAGSDAIRTPADTTLNMNALGTTWQAGTKIGLWSWGGGQPNETWTPQMEQMLGGFPAPLGTQQSRFR
ncbi:MAG TPA: hypothetical protein VG889_01490 [Rhizomicrobium sp.]|nr:hypothetical protein [Rhizomicrobium sp.]